MKTQKSFFLCNSNRLLFGGLVKYQALKFILFVWLCQVLFLSCDSQLKINQHEISISDSVVLNMPYAEKFSTNVLKNYTDDSDSAILVLDKENQVVYSIDRENKNVKINKLKNSYAWNVFIYHDSMYLLEPRMNRIVSASISDSISKKVFQLPQKRGGIIYEYYSLFNPFVVKNRQGFIYSIGSYNVNLKEERARYFADNVIQLILLRDSSVDLFPVEINFPLKYKYQYFYDFYPNCYIIDRDNYIYTFKYTDSIFVCYKGKDMILPIPKEYSVQTNPIPDSNASNTAFINEYEIINPMNLRVLLNGTKVYCIQKNKIDLYDKEGNYNSFDDAKKTIIVFDLNKNHEYTVYRVPFDFSAINTFVFNEALFLPVQNSKGLVFYETFL